VVVDPTWRPKAAVRAAEKSLSVTLGCLALNASFEPLTMVPLKRALRLVIDGKAEIVEADRGRTVRSERLAIPRPAVIRLRRFVHVPRRFRRQVTNTFLFARDGYRCQYCGRASFELRPREALTRDHVVPISRGGLNVWTNVVTACSACNTRKADHLVSECGMHLSWAVRRLTPTQARYIKLFYGSEVVRQLEAMERRHGGVLPPEAQAI
jgi:5-methylcytosine-specific restriction endonuclease McrA